MIFYLYLKVIELVEVYWMDFLYISFFIFWFKVDLKKCIKINYKFFIIESKRCMFLRNGLFLMVCFILILDRIYFIVIGSNVF